MDNIPLVSVITSNYNGAGYLPDCVSSVLNQSFDSWEHIIIDCGSTDNSRKVLESLKHPRLRVIHEEFCGVARARNRAIQQARGEFCAILDADDRALPDRLRLQVELLRKDKALVAVGGNAQRICSSHRRWKSIFRRHQWTTRYPLGHEAIMLFLRSTLSPILHSTLTFRKTIFQEMGGYREDMEKAEDFDLVLRLGLHGRLGGVHQRVGILRFGAADSHTTRHQPQGRDVHYYAVLALLFNTARVYGFDCDQKDIEEWLDNIGKDGISALRGRWIWENLIKHNRGLSWASWDIPLKSFILLPLAMMACWRRSWWPAAFSPENIIEEFIRDKRWI